MVWFAFLLSEGAHRLARVAPWGTAPLRPLRRCLDSQGRPRALAADRWATLLDALGVAARWGACDRALPPSGWRVDDLQGRLGRVDTTTAAASGTPAGLCQRGPSTDPRPALPQGQRAMAVLDPLGGPWTSTVVAGHPAAAPLALPARAPVRQSAQRPGLTSVGDSTMAASGTRAAIVAPQDASGGPLSAKQRPDAARDRGRAPVWRGAIAPSAIRVPPADGVRDAPAEPVALGGADPVERSALDHAGQPHTWQARRRVVRSRAWAARQEQRVRPRVARAVTALNALDARTPGTRLLPDAAGADPAAAASMATQRGEGLVPVPGTPAGPTAVQRRYGIRPATTVRRARVRGRAAREEAPRAHAVRRLGWRVDATHHPVEERRLAQGGAASRRESLVAQGFGRLHGRSLSLTPLCLQDAHRMVGLRALWRIALRGLGWIPCVVRRPLQHAGPTRTGLSPGQPGRQTAPPPTEMLGSAVRGVTLSHRKSNGTLHAHLTPWNAVPKRILALREVPRERSGKLVA